MFRRIYVDHHGRLLISVTVRSSGWRRSIALATSAIRASCGEPVEDPKHTAGERIEGFDAIETG
jgi:hypothetical protein